MVVVCKLTEVLLLERQGKLLLEKRLKLNFLKMRGQRRQGLTT